jgi:hypothetical protein
VSPPRNARCLRKSGCAGLGTTSSVLQPASGTECIQEQKAIDKGGRTNLFNEQYGPPAWILVTGAWHTYNLFKPNQAVGSDGSSFHLFINEVHEYATGSSKENSTLQYWMTKLVKARRQNDQLLQKLSTLESKLDELNANGRPESNKAADIAALERDISSTRQAAIDLFPKLLPSASSRKKKCRQLK